MILARIVYLSEIGPPAAGSTGSGFAGHSLWFTPCVPPCRCPPAGERGPSVCRRCDRARLRITRARSISELPLHHGHAHGCGEGARVKPPRAGGASGGVAGTPAAAAAALASTRQLALATAREEPGSTANRVPIIDQSRGAEALACRQRRGRLFAAGRETAAVSGSTLTFRLLSEGSVDTAMDRCTVEVLADASAVVMRPAPGAIAMCVGVADQDAPHICDESIDTSNHSAVSLRPPPEGSPHTKIENTDVEYQEDFEGLEDIEDHDQVWVSLCHSFRDFWSLSSFVRQVYISPYINPFWLLFSLADPCRSIVAGDR